MVIHFPYEIHIHTTLMYLPGSLIAGSKWTDFKGCFLNIYYTADGLLADFILFFTFEQED